MCNNQVWVVDGSEDQNPAWTTTENFFFLLCLNYELRICSKKKRPDRRVYNNPTLRARYNPDGGRTRPLIPIQKMADVHPTEHRVRAFSISCRDFHVEFSLGGKPPFLGFEGGQLFKS